jgi:hypothetical protein
MSLAITSPPHREIDREAWLGIFVHAHIRIELLHSSCLFSYVYLIPITVAGGLVETIIISEHFVQCWLLPGAFRRVREIIEWHVLSSLYSH